MSLFHHEDPAGGPFSDLPPEARKSSAWDVPFAIVLAIIAFVLIAHWSACEDSAQFTCLWSEL